MRLKRLIELFCEWCDGCRQPSTTKNYRYLMLKFARQVGDLPIKKLKPFHLSYAKTWHEVQAVQRLFQWAMVDMELVDRNVFAKVKRPPAGHRTRILSPRELAAYFRRAKPAFRRFLTAMRETLARPQEIRCLQWEWLTPEQPRQTIEEALRIGRAVFVLREYKSRERRMDPTTPRLLLVTRRLGRMLLRLLAQCPERKGPVFTNMAGRAWTGNAVRCCMRRLRVKFKKPDAKADEENVVAYSIRHSLATIAAAAGVRDRVLADIMGHTNTNTTARYQHLNVEHLRAAFDLIEKASRQQRKPQAD